MIAPALGILKPLRILREYFDPLEGGFGRRAALRLVLMYVRTIPDFMMFLEKAKAAWGLGCVG